MRWSGRKVFARLGLLLLAASVCGWFFLRPRSHGHSKVEQLLAELRWQGPWHYRVLKRTNTLRFLPKRWSVRAEVSEFELSLRKWRAVVEFGKLGTNAWPAVPSLTAMVKKPETALYAAQALALAKAEQHPEWGRLQRDLSGQSVAARSFHYLLAGRNQYGRPFDLAERRFGLIGLSATGPAAVVAQRDVVELLQPSQEPELWLSAVIALRSMHSKTNPVPILRGILQNQNEWPNVSASAAQALAGVGPGDPEAQRLLQEALQDRRSQVRLAAARALWRLKAPPEEVLPVLTALLQHKLATVRAGALDGLSEMGSAARPSRASVEQLTSDENETVRRSARAALRNIIGEAELRSQQPNQPAGGHAGAALQLAIGYPWLGVPQPGCWTL